MAVPIDRQLANFATRQHGLFSRTQAHSIDVSDRMLQLRVHAGRLDRLSREVFRIAGAPSTWRQQLLAAVFDGGPDCCVSHRAAAALHTYDGFRPGIIEVVHHQRRTYRRGPGITIHVTSVLDPADRTIIDGIPVTTAARTLIDLGAVVEIERVEEALDGAERDGSVNRLELATRHAAIRQRGRNGVAALAKILDTRAAQIATPHSVLERRMLRLLAAAGLPRPECQVRVKRADGRIAFLDLAYSVLRVGMELDGHAWHSTARQRQRDNDRQNQVVITDWSILRFTYQDITKRPDEVAALVRRALLAAGGRHAVPA